MGNPQWLQSTRSVADLPIGDIAAKLGVDEATARKAVDDALPALLAGMGANATDPAGAASLERAVKSHDPSLVEGGVNLADVDEEDGRKIVKNVFGDNTDQVVTALDKKEGGGAATSSASSCRSSRRSCSRSSRSSSRRSRRARSPRRSRRGGGIGDVLGGLLGGGSRRLGRLGRRSGGGLGDVLGGLLGGGGSGGSGGGGGLGDLLGGLLGGGKR